MNDKLLFFRTMLAALLAVALLLGGPASAQQADIDRCADLESDAERLACFDAAMKNRVERTTPAAPPESAPPQEAARPPAAPGAASAAAAATAAAAPPSPTPAAESPAAAGEVAATEYRYMTKEEKKAARQAKKQQEKARREYTAVVTGMRERPHGQVVVTLDNGEVWSEQYASRGFLVSVGDTVTMKKSRFSSAYRLVDENGKGYAVTRLE